MLWELPLKQVPASTPWAARAGSPVPGPLNATLRGRAPAGHRPGHRGVNTGTCQDPVLASIRVSADLSVHTGLAVRESELAQSCPTLRPRGLQPTRLLCPWAPPGENTGVGCHFLLQGVLPPPPPPQGLKRSPALWADALLSGPPGESWI